MSLAHPFCKGYISFHFHISWATPSPIPCLAHAKPESGASEDGNRLNNPLNKFLTPRFLPYNHLPSAAHNTTMTRQTSTHNGPLPTPNRCSGHDLPDPSLPWPPSHTHNLSYVTRAPRTPHNVNTAETYCKQNNKIMTTLRSLVKLPTHSCVACSCHPTPTNPNDRYYKQYSHPNLKAELIAPIPTDITIPTARDTDSRKQPSRETNGP